jgi:hypothetical protein
MFRALHQLFHILIIAFMCCLPINIFDLVEFTFVLTRVMWLYCLLSLNLLWKTYYLAQLKSCSLMEELNYCLLSNHIHRFSSTSLVPIHHNRMVSLKGNIDMLWSSGLHSCFMLKSLKSTGLTFLRV